MKDAYRRVMDRVAAAAQRSGRRAEDVIVVAVTKSAGPDQMRQLVELGHGDLGESRVQQLSQRVALIGEFLARHRTLGRAGVRGPQTVPARVRWHMVGHLQRNKVRQLLPLVQLIHSVDSLRLAEEIHTSAVRMDRVADVLLQVNASTDPSKFGVAAPAVQHLAEQIDTMVSLRLRGIMTMAPLESEPDAIRACFGRAAEIFSDIRDAGIGGQHFTVLSMGMTNDFEIAIEHGANVVRIGRAIFGESEEP